MENFTSKKFSLAILSVISCSGLMWAEKISDGVYSTIMVATIGAYLAANVIQKKELLDK